MTVNRIKLGCAVTFTKHLATAAALIIIRKTLIWNKITFPASNLLNFAEVVENELSPKYFTNIPFSIQFITV